MKWVEFYSSSSDKSNYNTETRNKVIEGICKSIKYPVAVDKENYSTIGSTYKYVRFSFKENGLYLKEIEKNKKVEDVFITDDTTVLVNLLLGEYYTISDLESVESIRDSLKTENCKLYNEGLLLKIKEIVLDCGFIFFDI